MNTRADKTQENKSQVVANEASRKQSVSAVSFQFVDNRPETIQMRKLQAMANNSPQAMQLKAFQEMTNNSPQAKQAAQSQAMADNHAAQQPWHVVKQKQVRVKPTMQMKGGVNVNDDARLEKEADVMGLKALPEKSTSSIALQAMLRVKTGKTTKIDSNNEGILKDALEALLEVQKDTVATIGSFAETVSTLADYVRVNGFNKQAETDLENLYLSLREVSFKSNPILNESWSRCIESTRSAAAKSMYSKVGGKFNKKFEEVLNEIASAYPSLSPIVGQILTCDVSKEHMINKGLGGLQTANKNLMDAGVGNKHTGGTGTLSTLHKELHRLKSGGTGYDYKTMDVTFETIVQDVQDNYDSDDMGVLNY